MCSSDHAEAFNRSVTIHQSTQSIDLMKSDPAASAQNENVDQTSIHVILINACYQVAFCSLFLMKGTDLTV